MDASDLSGNVTTFLLSSFSPSSDEEGSLVSTGADDESGEELKGGGTSLRLMELFVVVVLDLGLGFVEEASGRRAMDSGLSKAYHPCSTVGSSSEEEEERGGVEGGESGRGTRREGRIRRMGELSGG